MTKIVINAPDLDKDLPDRGLFFVRNKADGEVKVASIFGGVGGGAVVHFFSSEGDHTHSSHSFFMEAYEIIRPVEEVTFK